MVNIKPTIITCYKQRNNYEHNTAKFIKGGTMTKQ